MTSIRVMHVLNTGLYSGAENVAISIITSTRDLIESTYVSLPGQIAERLRKDHIAYFPVQRLTISNMREALKSIKPDVIHAHDFTAGVICAATGTKVPIINHLHNNTPWIKKRGLRSCVYGLSSLRYAKILTVSNSIVSEYVFGQRIKKKVEMIGNPIDLARIRSLAYGKEMQYDIAFLGRFSPQKNPILFLDIIEEVQRFIPDIKSVMIGDGELRPCVEREVRERGLIYNIELVGFQENPYTTLNESRILLMPSAWEGYGLAAVEALALGKPVICSDAGGLPNIVDETCGRVCSNKDDYQHTLLDLLHNESKYAKLSFGALRKAESLSNMEEYAAKIVSIYQEVSR